MVPLTAFQTMAKETHCVSLGTQRHGMIKEGESQRISKLNSDSLLKGDYIQSQGQD